MDHLPIVPTGTAQGLETVPYVCQKSYDGGPFLTYPMREERPGAVLDAAHAGIDFHWEREKRHPTPNKEYEAFCQTWLFFGLINELLGNFCKSADFVRSNEVDDSRTMSTSRLHELIGRWMMSIEDGTTTMSYEHVAKCLRLTHAALLAAGPEFDPRIKICIASMGELFGYAANKVFKIQNLILDDKCPKSWLVLSVETVWIERLRRSNWCPSQIEIMTRSPTSLQVLYFFATMQDAVPDGRHGLCDNLKCVAYQTDLKHYTTQHVAKNCKCEELCVDISIVNAVLKTGAQPLLRIREAETLDQLTVEIVASQPDSCYLALSHVWADGLGNAKANALPRCQLLHLRGLTESLREQLSAKEPQIELLFWCDTLCCPAAPGEGKNRVLAQMKNIYEQATCVLVLDASLRLYESEAMGAEETCARILASGWIRRLWTFQEGAVSASKGRLWFQFRDRAVHLRPLWNKIVVSFHSDWSRWGLNLDIVHRMGKLVNFFRRETGADLAMVDAAFHQRSVSVSSDEPLLIGALLGLDVGAILSGSDETRIHRMWSLMPTAFQGIPKDIIFRLGPRLQGEGYRWAAATMLYHEDSNAILQMTPMLNDQGTPTEDGLMVRLPGYHISFPPRPSGLADNPWSIKLDENSFLMRDDGASWYHVVRRWPNANGDYLSKEKFSNAMRSHTNLWVTHLENAFQNQSNSFHKTSRGLLTRLVKESCGVKYVQSYMHIDVVRDEIASCEMLEAAYRCAQQLTVSAPAENLAKMSKDGTDLESPEYKAVFDALERETWRITASEENDLAKGIARQRSGKDTDVTFVYYVLLFFIVGCAIVGPRMPDGQQWCVD